jgi:hypothetical protein
VKKYLDQFDLRFVVRVRPLPWHWKLKPNVYTDDVEGPLAFSEFAWLFLTVEWWGP